MTEWYRVTDPLSPLAGCDVKIGEMAVTKTDRVIYAVTALRRVDIFLGDRPYQLVAPGGSDVGVFVTADSLQESPIQDEIVEIVTDRPYGKVIDESEMERNDGLRLHVVHYERATQIALLNASAGNKLLATSTELSEARDFWEEEVLQLFSKLDCDVDDLIQMVGA